MVTGTADYRCESIGGWTGPIDRYESRYVAMKRYGHTYAWIGVTNRRFLVTVSKQPRSVARDRKKGERGSNRRLVSIVSIGRIRSPSTIVTEVHLSNRGEEVSANDEDRTGPDGEYGIAQLNDRGPNNDPERASRGSRSRRRDRIRGRPAGRRHPPRAAAAGTRDANAGWRVERGSISGRGRGDFRRVVSGMSGRRTLPDPNALTIQLVDDHLGHAYVAEETGPALRARTRCCCSGIYRFGFSGYSVSSGSVRSTLETPSPRCSSTRQRS